MKIFEDIHHVSLNKVGEELCGDQVRVLRTENKTIIVLSDGLGSGVKANILASLTVEIIINMLREEASLVDVIETITGTLPVCKQRRLAYATFTVIEIDHQSLAVKAYNFDNPPILFFRAGRRLDLPQHTETILGRNIKITEGQLADGDFLTTFSDGVLFAGLGNSYNYNWGLDNMVQFIENIFKFHPSTARTMVQMTTNHLRELYGGRPGDDAAMAGLFLRPSRAAMVFTGPPMKEADDQALVERLMRFPGQRIVCGGTTGNIVAAFTDQKVRTDLKTQREDLPPIGYLEGIDLLTEGILTLNQAGEWIDQTQGDPAKLPRDDNGAVLLARALLNADEITFLVGQKANPNYQNPLLPTSISIRKNLVERLIAQLSKLNKKVLVEYH